MVTILNIIYNLRSLTLISLILITKEIIEKKKLNGLINDDAENEASANNTIDAIKNNTIGTIDTIIKLYNIYKKMLVIDIIIYLSSVITMVILLNGYGQALGIGRNDTAQNNLILAVIYVFCIYIYRHDFIKAKDTLELINNQLDVICESLKYDTSKINKIKNITKRTKKKLNIIMSEENEQCNLEENIGF